MKNFSKLMVLGAFLTASAWAIQTDFSAGVTTRWRNDDDEQKLQARVTLGLEADLGSGWTWATVGRSGGSYNDAWITRNLDDTEKSYKTEFHLREFHLSYTQPSFQVDLGALPVRSALGMVTVKDTDGFMDGARLALQSSFGNAVVSVGSVNDLDKAGFYDRQFESNYRELVFNRGLWEGANVEIGYEDIQDEAFISAIVSQNWMGIGWTAEYVSDQEREASHTALSAVYDFGNNNSFRYSFMNQDEEYGNTLRAGSLVDSGWTENGKASIFSFASKVNNRWGWYTQVQAHHDDSDMNRYDFGLRCTL